MQCRHTLVVHTETQAVMTWCSLDIQLGPALTVWQHRPVQNLMEAKRIQVENLFFFLLKNNNEDQQQNGIE